MKMNTNLNKKIKKSKNDESGIFVDWEKQFGEKERKNKELEEQLRQVRTKYEAMHSILQKKIPHEREYSKKEIKTMFEIFEKKDLKNAQKVMTKDPSLIFIRDNDYYQNTLLTKASKDGWTDGVELLMDLGVGVDGFIEIQDKERRTPLMLACQNGHLDTFKYLVENGANVEAKDEYGNTPLFEASSDGNLEVVKYLIEKGANIEEKGELGETLLIRASSYGELDIVKYLIEKGANIEAKDDGGNTALIRASYWGKLEVVKYLIEKGANIEAKNNDGKTPLIWASYWGKLEVVKYLIENGANIAAKNNDGKAALKVSKREVKEYLISMGAKE